MQKKMRILIHSDEYYPTAQACAYRMQVFAETFIGLGDDVCVITSSANKSNGGLDYTQRKERIIYSPTIRMKKKTTLRRMLNNVSFSITSIFSSFRVGKVDVVITTSPPPLISISGWMIAKIKRAKLIYDVRDIWPDVAIEMGGFSEKSFFCKVFRRITRFMYKHSDVITTVSNGKIKSIQNHVSSCSGKKAGASHIDKVWLVGNGFDENIVKSSINQSVVEEYGLNKKFTCVYIGNIGLAQGLGSLLDIAKETKHKDVQFLCFGMGAEKETLEKRANSEKISSVHFCGVLDHANVFSILSNAKISYIPLKNSRMKDSIPTKVYEALGIGCPILLVAEGDAVDVLSETKLGCAVSPDATDHLVTVFDEMIDHYEEYSSRKEEAKLLMCHKYSRQRIAEDFNRQIHCLCE